MSGGRLPFSVRAVLLLGGLGAAWGLFVGVWWLSIGLEAGDGPLSLGLAGATVVLSLGLLTGIAAASLGRSWGYVLTLATAGLWILAFAVVPLVTGVLFSVLLSVSSRVSVVALLVYAPSVLAIVAEVLVLLYVPRHREAFFSTAATGPREDAGGGYSRGLR